MNETYYSVYSSIWVHCTGSMARAGERGAIRKGCDAFKLGDGFGSEYKLHTGSLSILIVEESREGRVGQGLSEPRTGSKKKTQTQTGEVQTTIRPFISRT